MQVHHRLHLYGYMDYHLSCYHYIVSKEDGVSDTSLHVDLVDAWDAAVSSAILCTMIDRLPQNV